MEAECFIILDFRSTYMEIWNYVICVSLLNFWLSFQETICDSLLIVAPFPLYGPMRSVLLVALVFKMYCFTFCLKFSFFITMCE